MPVLLIIRNLALCACLLFVVYVSDSSASARPQHLLSPACEMIMYDAVAYNVDIGKGVDKAFENRRLISEVFDGTRHIYAGFKAVGTKTIQEAMKIGGPGDIIVVREGLYRGPIVLGDGIRLFGGYNEAGLRNILANRTVISNGGFMVSDIKSASEISGFIIQNPHIDTGAYKMYFGFDIRNCSNQLRITNNTVIDGSVGILAYRSNAIIYNNNIYGSSVTAICSTGSSLMVADNMIHDVAYGAMETYESSSVFRNNVIWNNTANFVIQGGSTTFIKGNTLYGGEEGIRYINARPRVTDNLLVKVKSVFNIYDGKFAKPSIVMAQENNFYANTDLLLPSSLLARDIRSQNSFEDPGHIDPRKGIYMSSLVDKGYSSKRASVEFGKIEVSRERKQHLAGRTGGSVLSSLFIGDEGIVKYAFNSTVGVFLDFGHIMPRETKERTFSERYALSAPIESKPAPANENGFQGIDFKSMMKNMVNKLSLILSRGEL